jgi:hypothetical protein
MESIELCKETLAVSGHKPGLVQVPKPLSDGLHLLKSAILLCLKRVLEERHDPFGDDILKQAIHQDLM